MERCWTFLFWVWGDDCPLWSRNLECWAVVSPSPCEAGGVAAQQGWISLFIDIVQKKGLKNEFFPPFRTEEHCDLGWDKGQSCGVWQDKANSFLSCCFISHAFCATLSLFFSPYVFHDNIRRAGSSPYPTGGNFILAFFRGGAGILISIVGLWEEWLWKLLAWKASWLLGLAAI